MTSEKDILGSFDVAVVGAGPAGLMAAIAAARAGASVAVCEKLDRPGVRLLATGGGRCNLANTLPAEKFMSSFGRHGRFMQPALASMDGEALRQFFADLGVPTEADDGFHIYPASHRALDVQSALVRECQKLGVKFFLSTAVTEIMFHPPGRCAGLKISNGEIVVKAVVLAGGGKSYPDLGGGEGAYDLARRAGHSIEPLSPALAPLLTAEDWPRSCAGVSLPNVRIWIDLAGCSKAGVCGDVLFTHTGISGPAALDISADVAEKLKSGGKRDSKQGVPIRLGLVPGTTRAQWIKRLDEWGHKQGAKSLRASLAKFVPASLADVLCDLGGADGDVPVSRRATRPQRDNLAGLLTGLPLTVRAVGGFDQAMVTRGGVRLKEVDPRTLHSRLVAGLYLAGELLDLDGPSGGYNLLWAFASGHLAGQSAAKQK